MRESAGYACDADSRVNYSTLNPEHKSYLEKRGILKSAIASGVHSIMGRQSALIKYPYTQNWFKTYEVGSDNPWRQVKPEGASLPLFLIDQVDFSKPWVLTEGENDALAARESGISNVISLPNGAIQPNEEAPSQSGKLAAFREAWPDIQKGGGACVLALDNDAPGHITRDTLIDLMGRWRCRVVEYPEHELAKGLNGLCKDLNEVLLLFGPVFLKKLLKAAKPIKLEGVFKPSEIPKRPPRVYYSTGLPGLDENIRLFPGELCVWTGHTGHGKSNTLLGVLGHLAQCGLKIGLASFEADYHEDILPWCDTWLHGEETSESTLQATHQWLEERFVFISHEIEPLQAPATAEWFISQAQDAKGRFGIDVLVCDPWNKLQHKRARGENETEYIGRALAEFRNFAQAYNVICIVTAHPTKESGKEGEVPSEFDIHGSMNWGNAADHVVIIYRPDKKLTLTLIDVPKVRIRKSGMVGGKWYVFTERTNKYTPCAEHMIPNMKKDKPKRRKAA